MALVGCTTLGTNISGDFSCRAPNGTCAPSTVIDDRALALIAGGVSTQPAGAYPMAPTHSAPRMASAGPRPPGATVARTDQKVLTVVFPAHVDAKGRLFEATTVRTVVDTGSWTVASGSSPVRMVGTSTDRSTLLPHPDALGATEPAADSLVTSDMMPALAADPDLPRPRRSRPRPRANVVIPGAIERSRPRRKPTSPSTRRRASSSRWRTDMAAKNGFLSNLFGDTSGPDKGAREPRGADAGGPGSLTGVTIPSRSCSTTLIP